MTADPKEVQAELLRRKQILEDAAGLSDYLPDELRANLEVLLTPEARNYVLQLQILAIQYGRKLQQRDDRAQIVLTRSAPKIESSNLVKNLIARMGDDVKPTDPKTIMIVPGHKMPTKG